MQTIGRAARNADGEVIMYADKITPSMDYAIRETQRRRKIQNEYNEKNGIVPKTIVKEVRDILEISANTSDTDKNFRKLPRSEKEKLIKKLTAEMKEAAKILEFEHAALIRDKIEKLKSTMK